MPDVADVVGGTGALILAVPTALVTVAYTEHVLNKVYNSYGIER